jgi:rhamnogalacturonyl hydrolase YesR
MKALNLGSIEALPWPWLKLLSGQLLKSQKKKKLWHHIVEDGDSLNWVEK